MAGLNGTITVEWGLRPCIVDGKKGLFHCWENYADTIAPSPMVGGSPGGQYSRMFALVELESGNVIRADSSKVQFVDNPFADYAFPESEN